MSNKVKINRPIMSKAISEAKSSSVIRGKVGAVLFTAKGHIVTFAHNETYYGQKDKCTIHAEEYVISKALRSKIFQRFSSEKLCLLVVRIKQKNKIANAKPCEKCQKLLENTDLTVYHSTDKGQIVEMEW